MGVSYPDGTPSSTSDDTELRYYPDADRVSELSSAATDAHHRFAIVQPKMVALRHAGAYATVTPTTANPSGVKLVANVHRLGMGKTASMSLDVPQVHLDRVRSMTGKTKEGVYGGWDRFGRLKQQVWALTPTPAPTSDEESGQRAQGWMQDISSSPTYPEVRPVYQHAYSYSADSDRLSDDDLRPMCGKGTGESAEASDRKYTYDNLRRLTKEENGRFWWNNGSRLFAARAGSRSWSLDMLGNWKSVGVTVDVDGNGTVDTTETSTRTHDAQNQLISLGATTGGGGGGTPEYIRAYDKNGNLITETKAGDSKPTRRFIYDAWNRLLRVERGPGGVGVAAVEPTPVATYTYNSLNWRVTERVRWPGDAELSGGGGGYTRTRVFFFSSDWQVLDALEDRHAPTTSSSISTFTPDSETQFVWGVRDKDELLAVRTRALTNSSGTVITPVTPWTDTAVNTIYALSDAQMSVAGYVNSSGRVREARLYDSYGRMTRTLPGDLNGDGVCDDADFGIFDISYNLLDCAAAGMPGSNAGTGGGGNAPTWGCPADLNGDWVVDETDFGIFAASYNQLVPDVDALASGNAAGGGIGWGPGWNGYWFDPATGLWLSRNRWYDPEAGRWITRDPAGYVDGLSLYLYVKGNPFLFRDPSGLYSWSEWGQIGAAFLSGVGHQAGQVKQGATNFVVNTAINAVDGAGLAADAVANVAGYNLDYQPIGDAGAVAANSGASWSEALGQSAVNGGRAGLAVATYGGSEVAIGLYEYAQTGDGDALGQHMGGVAAGNGAGAVGLNGGLRTSRSPAPTVSVANAPKPSPSIEPLAERAPTYKGGAYEELSTNAGTLDRHHMPADSVSPIPKSKGPAIQMERIDHRQTSSYGRGKAVDAYRETIGNLISDGNMRAAMTMEVRDIRGKFGTKYNSAMLEALRYGKAKGYIPQRCSK